MDEIVKSVFTAPLAVLFIVGGTIFLLIAVIGNVRGKIEPGTKERFISGILGLSFVSIGLMLHLLETKTKIPSPSKIEQAQLRPNQSSEPLQTPIANPPEITPDLPKVPTLKKRNPEISKKVEQQAGEATCYDEADVNSLILSLQKAKEAHERDLIDILELGNRQKKLVDDFNHLTVQGPSTVACISQKLRLVRSLHKQDFIDVLQWQSSHRVLWKTLRNLLLAKVQSEEELEQVWVFVKQLYDQDAIDILEFNATRKALSEKFFLLEGGKVSG